MTTKALLLVTALLELGTGTLLLVVPAQAVQFLLGDGLAAPPVLVVARVAGLVIALTGLVIAIWKKRKQHEQLEE